MNTTNEVMTQDAKTTQEGSWIELNLIDASEYARQHNPDAVKSLGSSLGREGQLQNVVLLCKTDGRYEAVIGSGRIEAARQIGWQKIRADVKEGLSEGQKLAMVVAENEEREDACPFYTAMLYERMFRGSGKTQEEFAGEVGKDPAVLSKYLALAKVPVEVWKDHQTGLTSIRQCVEIAKVKDLEHQKKLAEACAKEGLSGAAAKKRAKVLVSGGDPEFQPAKEEAPQAPFTFAWKGNGLLIKARLFQPHAQGFSAYLNELSDAYDRFMESEKSKPALAA
jgi:ParB/RepB/Spo0J family partition protein